MSELIKAVWGGEHPRVIFLTDGTKISLDGNGKNVWMKIGKASIIVAHAFTEIDCNHEFEWIGGGNTPDGITEPEQVCKHCGSINQDD